MDEAFSAYHEAAHAIVSASFGWPVRSVVARTRGEGSILWARRKDTRKWRLSHQPPADRLTVTVAGYLAETRLGFHADLIIPRIVLPSTVIERAGPTHHRQRGWDYSRLHQLGGDYLDAMKEAYAIVRVAMDWHSPEHFPLMIETIRAAEERAWTILQANRGRWENLTRLIEARRPRVVRGIELATALERVRPC